MDIHAHPQSASCHLPNSCLPKPEPLLRVRAKDRGVYRGREIRKEHSQGVEQVRAAVAQMDGEELRPQESRRADLLTGPPVVGQRLDGPPVPSGFLHDPP